MIHEFKIGIFKKMVSSRIGKVLFEGKTEKKGTIYIPYGMFANIEENIPAGILLDQGNESSLLFLPFDIENRELLDKNEIGFGIPSGKDRIYFRKDKITFKIGGTEGGDSAVRFNELKAGFDELKQDHNDLKDVVNQLLTHGHLLTTPDTINGSTTSIIPVIPPEPSSTASIDDSEVPEIELPEL